jgi:tellurite resistance protein
MQREKKQSWLKRLHPGLFGMSLGLLSLSFAWRKYAYVSNISTQFMEMALLSLGVAILCLLTVLWSIKAVLHPAAIKEKFLNPVLGPMMAYLPISPPLFWLGH